MATEREIQWAKEAIGKTLKQHRPGKRHSSFNTDTAEKLSCMKMALERPACSQCVHLVIKGAKNASGVTLECQAKYMPENLYRNLDTIGLSLADESEVSCVGFAPKPGQVS